jgi:hypothetical protein
VEELQLWVGTYVGIQVYAPPKYVRFKTTIKKRFRFTIPKLELSGSRTKLGDIVEVKITKLEPPKA